MLGLTPNVSLFDQIDRVPMHRMKMATELFCADAALATLPGTLSHAEKI